MAYDTRLYSRQYLILGSDSLLTAARSIAVAGGLFIQDGGAGSTLTISGSGFQSLSSNLTALSSYNTNGFVTQTSSGVFAGRTLAVDGGLTIQEVGTVITISASGVSGGSSPFVSSDQTITSAGALTIAHGLGSTPKLVWAALVCQTAEFNYSIGNIVMIPQGQTSTAYGYSVVPDATNLNVRFSSTSNCFVLLDKSSGAPGNAITNSSWKIRFYAQ